LYRRVGMLGTDQDVINKNEKQVIEALSAEYPTITKAIKFTAVMTNHVIEIFAFTFYIVALSYMRRSVLNLGSLVVVLVILFIFLKFGNKSLFKYWSILCFYSAFVLLS
jgi:hypothetical protein